MKILHEDCILLRPLWLAVLFFFCSCGKEPRPADYSDLDGDVDTENDGAADADNDKDGDRPWDGTQLLDCTASLDCVRECEGNRACISNCVRQVCSAGAVPLQAFLECAVDLCSDPCLDPSSRLCLVCTATECYREAIDCFTTSCAAYD